MFKDSQLADIISDMGDEELDAWPERLTKGVFTGSPVFDGAREERDQGAAGTRGTADFGQDYLHDGMTGDSSNSR